MSPPDFKPPQNEEEFNRRAKEISTEGAKAVISSLRARREAVVKPIDQELAFYKRILARRGETF